jgi:predicted ATPase
MPEPFNDLYRELLRDVILEKAREHIEQGGDALSCADVYADQGKPDFVLAYLLLTDVADEVKREIFAHSYEQRAIISAQKADAFDKQFHRPFPLIKLEAQKDRLAAQHVRQGRRIRKSGKSFNMN